MRGGCRYNAGRPGWRRKCEHMLRFGLRQLTKKGRVAAGQSYGWYWFRDEESIASISVRTVQNALLLDYTWTPNGSRPQAITCRIGQRLAYSFEAESPIDRCWRAQRKLEAKLTEDGERPKGMRRKTFDRINQRWAKIEERKDDLFLPHLLRLVGYL